MVNVESLHAIAARAGFWRAYAGWEKRAWHAGGLPGVNICGYTSLTILCK